MISLNLHVSIRLNIFHLLVRTDIRKSESQYMEENMFLSSSNLK